MPAVPTKIYDRIIASLKRFQPILASAKARDAGEADTSTIAKDMLSEIFGYDKYAEITSEYMIKSTFCDLAVKLEGKLHILIEVKAIGLELKDNHVRQAVDYAANQGVEWVFLTNAAVWRIYRVIFGQPISHDLVYECDVAGVSPKNKGQVECLFLFAKEGQAKSVLDEFHAQKLATSRYVLGAVVLSDAVVETIRRELRRAFPHVKITVEELRTELVNEALKREITEGEKATEARKSLARAQGRALRAAKAKVDDAPGEDSTQSLETVALAE